MRKIKLNIPDSKMLELLTVLKSSGHIRSYSDFCRTIDMPRQNITNIRNGIQHFTAMHIHRACSTYNINTNWIMGVENNVFRRVTLVKHPLPKALPNILKTSKIPNHKKYKVRTG